MIAASEEFLREIAPHLSFDGNLGDHEMRLSAVIASSRLVFGRDWFSDCPQTLVISRDSATRGLASSIASCAYWERKYDMPLGVGSGKLDEGMPFVGWSINADSRRISGPAQPGEGEFIKYLGRDA